MQKYSLLLACDLDRTIFPNGPEASSEGAKILLKDFVDNSSTCLAYVSGRSLSHAMKGIKEFDMPFPNIYVGDVGTSMYIRNEDNSYTEHVAWQQEIGEAWGGITNKDIEKLLSQFTYLLPQENEHQNTFKQSYYFNIEDEERAVSDTTIELSKINIECEIISHVDSGEKRGYLDIIPKSINKEKALVYLQKYLSLSHDSVIFAGDGGNDLDPLTSGYQAIVVNNATQIFKEKVRKLAEEKNTLGNIYFAKGGYKEMNGNYIAGILEGLNYFKII